MVSGRVLDRRFGALILKERGEWEQKKGTMKEGDLPNLLTFLQTFPE